MEADKICKSLGVSSSNLLGLLIRGHGAPRLLAKGMVRIGTESIVINCKEASRLLSQAQDRSLAHEESAAVRFHLISCRMCREFERQLAFLRATMRRHLE